MDQFTHNKKKITKIFTKKPKCEIRNKYYWGYTF